MKRKYSVIAAAGLLMVGLVLGATCLATSTLATSKSQSLTLSPGFAPDPFVIDGVSGGSLATPDCGYIKSASPDYVITLTESFEFLQAAVLASGDVTLLIETSNGRRICSDDVAGLMPQISGTAAAGTYKVWIGDYLESGTGYPYKLSLTQLKSE